MKYIDFNGDKISKLSLGTAQFGFNYGIANKNGKPKQQEINEIVDYLYQNGINSFDTAQAYGESEEVLGKALENKNDIFVISKLKSELFIDNLELNVDSSLHSLNQNSLFGLMLHDSKLLYNWKDKYSRKVENLKQKEKIKYFGVSIYEEGDFKLAIENRSIDIIQIPFNIFDHRAVNQGWLDAAKSSNKLIFIRSVFLQGLFFMDSSFFKDNLKEAKIYIDKLNRLSKATNSSIASLAMAYVDIMARESVLLFGCETILQAKKNIESFNSLPKLSREIISQIQKEFKDIPENVYNPTKW